MKHRLRCLSIAIRNGLSRPPRWVLTVMLPIVAGWIVGVATLPGPEDRLVHYLSLLTIAGGFAVLTWFHVAMDLRTRYPPAVLIGGALCIVASGFCLWREFSPGLLLRLSLPLLLTGLLGFYIFYFSVLWGKQRVSRLQVGDRFPDFALPASDGSVATLASVIAKGPALMIFYKGDW